MSAVADTRRLYAWEAEVLDHVEAVARELTIREGRTRIHQACLDENHVYQDPTLHFDRGTPYYGKPISYCDVQSIHLVPGQRNLFTLYHELTHALGYPDHDRAFRKVYFRLVQTYTGTSIKSLWK
mgnify:FL=1